MLFSHQHPEEAQPFSISANGADMPLSDNFTLGEFRCKDGSDEVLVHPALVGILQLLRNEFGPVKITSAYRTEAYNERIGGSPGSKHKLGMAADVVVKGVSPNDVADFLEQYDPGGLGRYDTFTHVDVFGSWRRWDDRS